MAFRRRARPARLRSPRRRADRGLPLTRQVRGAEAAVEHRIHGGLDPLCVVGPIKAVAQHHRRREDGRKRVGDALAGDVGGGAVDRLEEARDAAGEVADRSMPSEPERGAAGR